MKKIIALLLCMLLPCAAFAEETADLWAQMEDYRADLYERSMALGADIESVAGDIAYIEAVLASAKMQMDALKAEQDALNSKIAAADQLLTGDHTEDAAAQAQALLPPPDLTGKHYIQIDIENYGVIVAELDADAAPITVTNFVKLVNEGFYDGLTFHRIISGFMIQGGDPLGNGTGGSSEKIKGEFSSNGWDNPIAHERGVLSMARSSAPDSASSQFFIMHKAAPHLDGSYAAFGRVLSGIEVVDAICQNTPVTDGNGSVAKVNQPVITSIKVIEKPE